MRLKSLNFKASIVEQDPNLPNYWTSNGQYDNINSMLIRIRADERSDEYLEASRYLGIWIYRLPETEGGILISIRVIARMQISQRQNYAEFLPWNMATLENCEQLALPPLSSPPPPPSTIPTSPILKLIYRRGR